MVQTSVRDLAFCFTSCAMSSGIPVPGERDRGRHRLRPAGADVFGPEQEARVVAGRPQLHTIGQQPELTEGPVRQRARGEVQVPVHRPAAVRERHLVANRRHPGLLVVQGHRRPNRPALQNAPLRLRMHPSASESNPPPGALCARGALPRGRAAPRRAGPPPGAPRGR
eukprot:1192782-Prorocentrum_minimum.AAC.3